MIDLNPFHWLGDKAKEGLSDVFTSMMMALWSAALWLMELVFGMIDRFLTPDVTDPGLHTLYSITLWLSLLVALFIGFGQIGMAAIRRDGRTLGSLVMGIAQYGAVVAGWVVVCGALILGCAGLTQGLLSELLNVPDFAGYSASAGMPNRVGGTVQAAVLGLCGLFLVIPAAFGYLLIMLVREAALLILTATMPIAAAGALGDGTKAWMWKSIRWFVAACLTSPLLALVVGIGVQISRASFPEADRTQSLGGLTGAFLPASEAQVGMAVVGCVVFVIGCFCPMVLFRLLAFVDPGTGSGASFRSTLSANGGVSGLVSGRVPEDQGSGAATQVSADGRAASESGADTETVNRFQSRTAKAFGAAGMAAGKTMDAIGGVASKGASMSVDVMGQAGVGNQGYYDTTPPYRAGKQPPQRTRVGRGQDQGGVANDPSHVGGADDVASVADDAAFLA
ncbi:hypothetical protein ASD81_04415 [Nocardioides sp. Root614]|nr:hypothetical protein ASD81_04415 [Nocardioides sp. Root614]KRA93323.1 hypothetical protein ASD84_04680 [Nocardioides sp. Root682]